MVSLKTLFDGLEGDPVRLRKGFSQDILEANALLHNGAATRDELAECLSLWCRNWQTCQFGKAAASQASIHFMVLREPSIRTWTDEEITESIRSEIRLWKQRAAYDLTRVAHSFVLVVASPIVALAAPNQALRAFSERVLQLTGWQSMGRRAGPGNAVSSDYLYLRNPSTQRFHGFRFNVDFFACAGDRRWWHDHRFPGGIAFTANSTGHMMRHREWYQGKNGAEAWAVKQAMLTVNNAQPTKAANAGAAAQEQGKVTWLRDLSSDGQPLVRNTKCPISSVPAALVGKDWTRYEGTLHTDHAVREEFFQDRDEAPTASRPYLMDLTYLFDPTQPDYTDFSAGRDFSEDQVADDIGGPASWTHRGSADASPARSFEEAAVVATQLEACQLWTSSPSAEE